MKWLIYKHTNKINGKVYIGQTRCDAKTRWRQGSGYKHNKYFYRAIQKYGWKEGFSHEILEDNIPTQEIANEREQQYITAYRSFIGFVDCNGYNMTIGGEGVIRENSWSSEEDEIIANHYLTSGVQKCLELLPKRTVSTIQTRAQHLRILKVTTKWSRDEMDILKNNYAKLGPIGCSDLLPGKEVDVIQTKAMRLKLKYTGKSWSTEDDEYLIFHYPSEGEHCFDYLLSRHPLYGIKSRVYDVLKLKKESKYKASKKVYCAELDKIFVSAKEAADILKLNYGSLQNAIKANKQYGGYHWKYVEE